MTCLTYLLTYMQMNCIQIVWCILPDSLDRYLPNDKIQDLCSDGTNYKIKIEFIVYKLLIWPSIKITSCTIHFANFAAYENSQAYLCSYLHNTWN